MPTTTYHLTIDQRVVALAALREYIDNMQDKVDNELGTTAKQRTAARYNIEQAKALLKKLDNIEGNNPA